MMMMMMAMGIERIKTLIKLPSFWSVLDFISFRSCSHYHRRTFHQHFLQQQKKYSFPIGITIRKTKNENFYMWNKIIINQSNPTKKISSKKAVSFSKRIVYRNGNFFISLIIYHRHKAFYWIIKFSAPKMQSINQRIYIWFTFIRSI